jgi:hypothetical protein
MSVISFVAAGTFLAVVGTLRSPACSDGEVEV